MPTSKHPKLFFSSSGRTWTCDGIDDPDRHRVPPDYAATPLIRPDSFAKQLGVGPVLLKNEASRFVLGASWAVYHALIAKLDLPAAMAAPRCCTNG